MCVCGSAMSVCVCVCNVCFQWLEHFFRDAHRMCEIWVYSLLCRTHIHALSQFSPQFALRILCFHLVFIQICTDTYIRMRIISSPSCWSFRRVPSIETLNGIVCAVSFLPHHVVWHVVYYANEQWASVHEMKSIENEDLCDCQAMPQHNEYEIHNYVLIYIKWGVCMCRHNTW